MARKSTGVAVMEQMEGRELLNGTVTIAYNGWNVTITGDKTNAQDLRVGLDNQGFLDVFDNTGTTDIHVKGARAYDPQKTSLTVTLGAGSDTLAIPDLQLKNLSINLGNGNNTLTLGTTSLNASGALTITGGVGADYIDIIEGSFGKTMITTGAGDDRFRIACGDTVETPVFQSTFTLDMGAGVDSLSVSNTAVGALADFNGLASIKMGEGGDTVTLGGGVNGNAASFNAGSTLDFGNGDDTFNVDVTTSGAYARFAGKTQILFNRGNKTTTKLVSGAMHFVGGGSVYLDARKASLSPTLMQGIIDSQIAFYVNVQMLWL